MGLTTMVSQEVPKIHSNHCLSQERGHVNSLTTRRDVNLQPEIMSVVRGVGEPKRKEHKRDQWVPVNMGRGHGIHTA